MTSLSVQLSRYLEIHESFMVIIPLKSYIICSSNVMKTPFFFPLSLFLETSPNALPARVMQFSALIVLGFICRLYTPNGVGTSSRTLNPVGYLTVIECAHLSGSLCFTADMPLTRVTCHKTWHFIICFVSPVLNIDAETFEETLLTFKETTLTLCSKMVFVGSL